MKRVTLLADRIESEGTSCRIYLTGSNGALYAHARHVLSVEDADARDFAPPAPPTAGSVLTSAELDALPVGSVVDATMAGVRVRAMRREGGGWWLSADVRTQCGAPSDEFTDAVLVTDGPIQPAPVKPLPLPTELGARFWGRTPDSEPTWWFIRAEPDWSSSYVPSAPSVSWVRSADVVERGLVRLPDPDASEVTA